VIRFARGRLCSWTGDATAAAAEGGHFELLRSLHGEGCPWGELTVPGAARTGRIDIIE
jgi:hypothetical protein